MLHSLRRDRSSLRRVPRGRLAALRVLPGSLAMVIAVRLGLSLSTLALLRRKLLPERSFDSHDLVQVGRIAWAVRTTSWVVPFASCLTQAQACQALLARDGIASTLCLGVKPGKSARMLAHAWLICDDRLVTGGEGADVAAFRLLTELGPVAA